MLKWKKNFGAIRWILSYAQCPLVDFWSIRYLYSKTDQMGKISKVLLCLKHVQSPRRIKFWDFFFQMNSEGSYSITKILFSYWKSKSQAKFKAKLCHKTYKMVAIKPSSSALKLRPWPIKNYTYTRGCFFYKQQSLSRDCIYAFDFQAKRGQPSKKFILFSF